MIVINIEELAKRLDSKAKIYDEVFVATSDIVSKINKACTGVVLSLFDFHPNIEIKVDPLEIIISIDPEFVKHEMEKRRSDIEDVIIGLMFKSINGML